MIPIIGLVRVRTLEEFGDLIRHPGEEFVYVIEGSIELHTEFYEPIILKPGEGAYLDSNMGHAYLAAPGCDEAKILGVCASADGEPGFTPEVQRALGNERKAIAAQSSAKTKGNSRPPASKQARGKKKG
jgi:hypothetical protein